jgi:uncharacterized protein YodC (DUF2158 family)
MAVRVFEVGSVVRLRGSGVAMTVERVGVGPEGNYVACTWFDTRDRVHHDRFVVQSLVLSGSGRRDRKEQD